MLLGKWKCAIEYDILLDQFHFRFTDKQSVHLQLMIFSKIKIASSTKGTGR